MYLILLFTSVSDTYPSDQQTCKALFQCSKIRSVWISALSSISFQYDTFTGTHNSMESMTLSELERACLSPDAFWDLFQDVGEDDIVEPINTHFLTPRKPTKFVYFSLVPGGRYVFTTSQDKKLQLWDIGNQSNDFDLSDPVATLVLDDWVGSFMPDVIPTNDGRGLRVLLRCWSVFV